MRLSKVSILTILLLVVVLVKADKLSLLQDIVSKRDAKAMTEIIARSCYSPTETRHDITTSVTCWRAGYTQERLLGRWWQGTCDAGYITINEYQTADNQQRVYRDASLGTPAGFVLESTFACLLPASSTAANTVPVFEMYKASISDYAYVVDPVERIALIQSGYTEVGILGRAKELNRFVRLKQCVQAANNIHNWVYQDEACPNGYVEELVLEGSILTNCDGETDTDLTVLYKYYSGTGSHRYLGTSPTAPAGYNITPLGCFWKPTTPWVASENRIPVYSYSFLQGADKDSRYASTSTTPTAPWVNDNTYIGFTFGQRLVQLKSCSEASGRYYFATGTDCPSGTTFSHISSLIWTYPCIGANQLPIKAVVNGAVRRAAVEPGQAFTSPNILPGAGFVNEYIIGCGVAAAGTDLSLSSFYPNTALITEAIWNSNGKVVLTHQVDVTIPESNTPLPPSGGMVANALLFTPPRYRTPVHACYLSAQNRHSFTTDVNCPASTTYSYTVGYAFYPPCLAGEVAVNSYVSETRRRLGTTAPQGYTFEKLVACTSASANSPFMYELLKPSTNDYKYAPYETYMRVVNLNGYVYNSKPNFHFAERVYSPHLACWNPTTSHRQFVLYGSCPSGYISENYRFAIWFNFESEPQLIRIRSYYSSSQTDNHYISGTSLPPSGYSYQSVLGWLKSVQEVGTYPVYQFRKTNLPSGSDTVLKINNTYIPPGYSQVGSVLGYAFNTVTTGCNPMYDSNCFNKVRSCMVQGLILRGYYINIDECNIEDATLDEGIRFSSIPSSNYQAVIGGPNLEPFCQYTRPPEESDMIIIPCSATVPAGYGPNNYTPNLPPNLGLMSTTPFPGLVPVYRYWRNGVDTDNWDSIYSTDPNVPYYTTQTLAFYALPPTY